MLQKEIRTGNDCWIGAGTVFCDIVQVGGSSITVENTLVTTNFPDNSIIAGVPAKLIKRGKYMYDSASIDEALCKLNSEFLEIKHSKEYLLGEKCSKLIYAVRHLKIEALYIGLRNKYVENRLKKSHKKNIDFLTYDDEIKTEKRIAIYTCITGNYDKPLEPLFVPENVDYYIVTDMDISEDSVWKKIDINLIGGLKGLDNTRKARYIKTHPHILFHEYEYSIWVDSNFRIIGDLSKFIKCIGKTIPFASNWHPERNSIYSELEACILRGKDDARLLRDQIESYRSDGMPEDFGLIETNMIVRKHGDPRCISLMEDWWKEIMRWSKRDQLSLPYVIWKDGYLMTDLGFIGNQIRNNPSVQVVLHESKYRCPTL